MFAIRCAFLLCSAGNVCIYRRYYYEGLGLYVSNRLSVQIRQRNGENPDEFVSDVIPIVLRFWDQSHWQRVNFIKKLPAWYTKYYPPQLEPTFWLSLIDNLHWTRN